MFQNLKLAIRSVEWKRKSEEIIAKVLRLLVINMCKVIAMEMFISFYDKLPNPLNYDRFRISPEFFYLEQVKFSKFECKRGAIFISFEILPTIKKFFKCHQFLSHFTKLKLHQFHDLKTIWFVSAYLSHYLLNKKENLILLNFVFLKL